MELLALFGLERVQVELPVGLGGAGDDDRRLNRLLLLRFPLQHHGVADDLEVQGIGHAAGSDDPKPVKADFGILADPDLQAGSMAGQFGLLGLRVAFHQFVGRRFPDLLQHQKPDFHVVALEPGAVGPLHVLAPDRHLERGAPFSSQGEDGKGLGLLGRGLPGVVRGPGISQEKQQNRGGQKSDLEHGFRSIIASHATTRHGQFPGVRAAFLLTVPIVVD